MEAPQVQVRERARSRSRATVPFGPCSTITHALTLSQTTHCHKQSISPITNQIDTTMGSFTVELYFKHAPRAAENFSKLADRGYYDGTTFHRVIKDFSEFFLV